MSTTTYCEYPASRPIYYGDSWWIWFVVGNGEPWPEEGPNDQIAEYWLILRQIQPGSEGVAECVWSLEVPVKLVIEADTGEPMTIPGANSLDYFVDPYNDEHTADRVALAGSKLLLWTYPGGQLICVELEESKKGLLWQTDLRNYGLLDTTVIYRVLGVAANGNFAVAFREFRWKTIETYGPLIWSDEWGVDDDRGDPYETRVLDDSSNIGIPPPPPPGFPEENPGGAELGGRSTPAGLLYLDPATGGTVARWTASLGDVRPLGPARVRREYKYLSFSWTPGEGALPGRSDVPRAMVMRPFESIWSYKPPGPPTTSEIQWSNNGHEKWGFASVRFDDGSSIIEFSSISASHDYVDPWHWVNGVSGSYSVKFISGVPVGGQYYASASQIVTWRYLGDADEADIPPNHGSLPWHSLANACITPYGVVFGPRSHSSDYRGSSQVGGEWVEWGEKINRFVFRAINLDGSRRWEQRLGRYPVPLPDDPVPPDHEYFASLTDVDGILRSTVPVCVHGQILAVISYADNYDPSDNGPTRFVRFSASSGAILEDRELDPELWGNGHPLIEREAYWIGGRFVCTIGQYRLEI